MTKMMDDIGSVAPIEKQTLHDQVANQLRDLIIEGVLEPGSRIDETALVERLGPPQHDSRLEAPSTDEYTLGFMGNLGTRYHVAIEGGVVVEVTTSSR